MSPSRPARIGQTTLSPEIRWLRKLRRNAPGVWSSPICVSSLPRRAPSIARLAVHHLPQRLAVEEAGEIFSEQARNEPVAVRVGAADVRQHENALGGPERMLGGQR